jgi:starch phosphorylase
MDMARAVLGERRTRWLGRASESHYEELELAVVPCFYRDRQRFLEILHNAIALNASFLDTQRMVLQYLYDAYLARPAHRSESETSAP